MDILSITSKSSVSADAEVYTKDGNDFVTTTFDALYKNSSAKTNIEKSVSDANARIDTTNNTVAELDNYARAKGNGIVLQSQGEMVTVNDSSDDYMVNLKPYGKSEQDSTTGKNLFGFDVNAIDKTEELRPNSSQRLIMKGLSENDFQCVYNDGSYSVGYLVITGIDGTKKYALSYEIIENTTTYTPIIEKSDLSNESQLVIIIRGNNGTNGVSSDNYFTVSNMQVELGEIATDYEPYTGNQPSPSPQYPQEIRSSVISEVRSCGKNLLKNTATSQTKDGVAITINEDKSVTVNGTSASAIYINLGVTKLTKGEFRATGTPQNGGVSSYRLYFETSSSTSVYYDNGTGVVISIDNEQYVYANLEIKAGTTLNNVTFYPMIRKADIEDDTYEPYTETVAKLSNPITLNAIPTDSGGNFTDSNGQQWIADYIDVDKGKVVRKIKKEIFDGTKTAIYSKSTDFGYQFGYSMEKYDTNIYIARQLKVLSSAFINNASERIINSVWYQTINNLGWGGYSRLHFLVSKEQYSTIEDVNKYFSNNPTTVIYELKDEIEEDLPTADKIALRNLKTFYSVTHVMNDSEVKGEMVLSYNADTKMYIDNKFAELAAQLV